MEQRGTTICDECGSSYYTDSSEMSALCPECAHVLHGYPKCEHAFEFAETGKRCSRCGWNGSRSEYVRGLLDAEHPPPAVK